MSAENYIITGREIVKLECYDGTVEFYRMDDIETIRVIVENAYMISNMPQSFRIIEIHFTNGKIKKYLTIGIKLSEDPVLSIDSAALTALLYEGDA